MPRPAPHWALAPLSCTRHLSRRGRRVRSHFLGLSALLCYSVPALLLPLGAVSLLLFFFPRVISALLALFFLWQIWPLLAELRKYAAKYVEAPYGSLPEGEDAPAKIKNGEEAVQVAMGGKTHYEIMHSHRCATPAELKACYRRMALMLHPDKNPDPEAAAAFKRVQDAWDSLSTPLARAEYDASVDNGLGLSEEGEGESEKEAVREFAQTEGSAGVPSGPPGLKKRRARPGKR